MSDLSFSIDVSAASALTADVPAIRTRRVHGGIHRKWESATTDRLNEAHWEPASGHDVPLDHDIYEDLPELRRRSRHEYDNNPHVQGTVATHAVDIVGPSGPSLEVQSDNDAYSDRLENRIREWVELCDYTGRSGLAEIIQTWIRQTWRYGCWVTQEVTASPIVAGFDFPASLRLLDIDPYRLDTPWDFVGDQRVAFGIRQTEDGIPTTYYIAKPQSFGPFRVQTGRFDPIPADMIHHGFIKHDAEQSTGIPLLASALSAVASLRDYDQHVLDAADMAASRSEWFVCTDPDGDKFDPGDESFVVPERRRVARAAPPGWSVISNDAVHPTAEYVGHRKERMAEIGRAVAMPLMLIRLDSSGHNYSSARFDHENYVRMIRWWQSWIARRFLTPIVKKIARELHLAGDMPAMPVGTSLLWNWTPTPEVDPLKSRGEEKLGLNNKTLPFAEACRRNNRDEDHVLQSWQRTYRKLKKLGFTPEEIAAFMSSWSGKLPTGTPNSARTANESPSGATGTPTAAR